jgi:branched-chain amino acid transport system permease protein
LASGLVFVILAAGLVLIMSTSRILFLCYGAFYTIGAYGTWYPMHYLKLPYFPSLIIGVIISTVIAMLSYLLIFRRLQRSRGGFIATLIAAMGLSMVLNQGGLLVYGTLTRSIPTVFPGSFEVGGITVNIDKLALIIIGCAITMCLFWVYEKTALGRSMRGVAFSEEASSLRGINTTMTYLLAICLGCALAGFAGGILAPSYGISPSMGNNVLWSVMLMVMLGGMDSLLGAVLGGLIIGQILSFGQYYLGAEIQIYLFLFIGIVLYFRPNGLLGRGIDVGI